MLSTNHLRLIGKLLLNHIDQKKIEKEYDLDESFIRNLRDDLIKMADQLDTKGEFEIELSPHPKYHEEKEKEDE
jgi:hypothetical protein